VALANVFPMANSGDTEMNQKMGKAEVLWLAALMLHLKTRVSLLLSVTVTAVMMMMMMMMIM
jgi:hypothetical protein